MNPDKYIDLIQKKENLKNDNQVRVALNWSMSKVNNYRHNRQAMDNETARQTAEILEMPVIKVIADMETFRAKRIDDKKALKAWDKLSKQAGLASTSLLICLSFIFLAVLHALIL